MIKGLLRRLYTLWHLGIASPVQSGSTSIQTTRKFCFGPSTAGMIALEERNAMKAALTAKYGIKEIED